ncbi:hypothetical protein EDEG_01569 [Edhazardia aedis USNM 41457]|uniref:Uncharacterized protein n=1 Tax=Edhazardia aedis (strain USNM 41457) TaxID=1003232 RepID=J8ZWU3_EDHAE|nr:hypothetical protein EDEG_01569 [Edhazardia aedis USNM 41457]|eukprot:EJW04133.1 hypothetical protein EDEG_01569 [Edhazardia aedis USNM 41457]
MIFFLFYISFQFYNRIIGCSESNTDVIAQESIEKKEEIGKDKKTNSLNETNQIPTILESQLKSQFSNSRKKIWEQISKELQEIIERSHQKSSISLNSRTEDSEDMYSKIFLLIEQLIKILAELQLHSEEKLKEFFNI